jgi:hypothetical protein
MVTDVCTGGVRAQRRLVEAIGHGNILCNCL